jgi:ribose 5-phosphate isomerase B
MLAIGCDHGGIHLKETIKEFLTAQNISFEDMGTYSEESVDYPDYAKKVAEAVVSGACEKGILICGTGIGISIAANKFHGIRAALCGECFSAKMSREHNDANVLCLGERVIGKGVALEVVKVWLETPFAGGRHAGRVQKIHDIEE